MSQPFTVLAPRPTPEPNSSSPASYALRQEQSAAIAQTLAYYRRCLQDPKLQPSFLWNAKPRFGKTLTAYSFAAQLRAQKVLIVTNRPAIADSWYTDFCKFGFNDTAPYNDNLITNAALNTPIRNNPSSSKFRWIFTSSRAVKKQLGRPHDIYTREEQTRHPALLAKNMIHFISLQDIKSHGADGFKAKNSWIFDLGKDSNGNEARWDLVIIDESHEGTDTLKAFRVFDQVYTKFTLHLSGTPFKALASKKFRSEQIYNWSYTDEQRAKQEWPLRSGPNPYAELPQMQIFTYQLPRILETSSEQAQDETREYAFDLGELFRVVKIDGVERFLYEDQVKLLLHNLSNPAYQYPFSQEAGRQNLRHTFWLLPGIKACEQLKRLLLEDEYFGKHYSAEDIILAAGDGDNDRATNTALAEVRRRIDGSNSHPLETRTITLSCGQLTMGVTVPAWSAVFMLNNCKSPSLYMQAAFRAQNPWDVTTLGGEHLIKTTCYVFDFAPDRILQTLAELADSGASSSLVTSREAKVQVLIDFLPVFAEDSRGKLQRLSAQEVLTIPLQLIADEIVNRGFMSNRLFKNIGHIFGCPSDIKDILTRLDEARPDRTIEPSAKKKSSLTLRPRVWLDAQQKIHINEDILIPTTQGLLSDKQYVEIDSDDGQNVAAMMAEAATQAEASGYSPAAIRAIESALAQRLPKLVTKLPTEPPQPGSPEYYDRLAPDPKPSAREKTEEEKVRDRLRGFARTIPSFLMAYGTEHTRLSNFEADVPDDVFLELTSITKDEFCKLRDGMDYQVVDNYGRPRTEHFAGVFNEAIVDSAIGKFMHRRRLLADYYRSDASEDIFEYILPQLNHQIFTPRSAVRKMLDVLEQESPGIFHSTTHRFIDPHVKSGMYLAEIARRLYHNARSQYPSDEACIQHILEHQIYGCAPSPILYNIAQNYLFGFDTQGKISRSHFIYLDTTPPAKHFELPIILDEHFDNSGENMKFTAVVGNPPYQEDITNRNEQPPIYNYFYDNAFELADRVCLVTPARFLFNAGKTPPLWNEKMLQDPHFKVVDYYPSSRDIFREVDIKGGIAITYRDVDKDFGAIDFFVPDATLQGIIQKVQLRHEPTMDQIIYANTSHRYTPQFFSDNPDYHQRVSGGSKKYLSSTVFEKFPEAFPTHLPSDGHDYARILGRINNTRVIRYFRSDYLRGPANLYHYKVFLASSSGCGDIGEALSPPFIGDPGLGATETFFGIGNLTTRAEAENLLKYLKTKFARTMLGVRKVTQSMKSRKVWKNVPVQDWSAGSDIDWSQSIADIDQQLYRKYQLSPAEIQFIETTAQEMI